MQKLIQSVFFLILLSPALCRADSNGKLHMELWLFLAYPSQFMLERTRPMLLHLNQSTGIHFSLKGGSDISKPLATCSEGMPQLIASSLDSARQFLEKCQYKVLVHAESKVHLVVQQGHTNIDRDAISHIGTMEGHPVEGLVRHELGGRVEIISYPDFLSLLKAYRNKTVDALTLPDNLLVPGTTLRRRWQTIHTFEGTITAAIIASPKVQDAEFIAIQNALLSMQASSTNIYQ